jgi:hypothetical protein
MLLPAGGEVGFMLIQVSDLYPVARMSQGRLVFRRHEPLHTGPVGRHGPP